MKDLRHWTGDDVKNLLENIPMRDGQTLKQKEAIAKSKLTSTLPDDMGLFKNGKRDSRGDLEDFTVMDSFDSNMNPELFTPRARKKLAHVRPESDNPKVIIINNFNLDGYLIEFYIELSQKFFSPNLNIPGIDGMQVYSVLSYLNDEAVYEIRADYLFVKYLSDLEDFHMRNGTAVQLPATIDNVVRLYQRD